MSKHKKTKEKITSNPPAPDITWSELKSFLEHIGYKLLKPRGGSSRKFYHQERNALFICHQPHPSPCVDKGCVVDLAEHLKVNGLI